MKKIFKKLSHNHWPIFIVGNINSLLNLFLPLFLVRIFSPEEMGLYKIFFLYVSLIPFFTMTSGLLTSFYYWSGFKNEFHNYSNSVWHLCFKYSLYCIIPFALLLTAISYFTPEIKLTYIPLILLSSLLAAPSALYGEYTLAIGKTKRSLVLASSFEFLKVLGFVLIAIKTKNMNYIFCFYALMMIVSFIVMNLFAYQDKAFELNRNHQFDKKVLDYTLPVSIGASISVILEKADQIILSTFLNVKDYAFYSMGCLAIPIIFVLESSVQKKLIPKISMAFQDQDHDLIFKELKMAIEHIAFLTIPSVVGLVLYSKEIITFLFTAQYLESAIYLQIFSISYLMYLIPFDSIYRSTGNSKNLLKINTFFAFLSILLILIFAYFTNATVTLSVSILVKFIHRYYCLNKSCKIVNIQTLHLYFSKKILYFFGVSLLLSGMCLFLNRFFENSVHAFFINGGIFALIYLSFFSLIKKEND